MHRRDAEYAKTVCMFFCLRGAKNKRINLKDFHSRICNRFYFFFPQGTNNPLRSLRLEHSGR